MTLRDIFLGKREVQLKLKFHLNKRKRKPLLDRLRDWYNRRRK